jgi:tetratricopeptide (TPR) repeat protein
MNKMARIPWLSAAFLGAGLVVGCSNSEQAKQEHFNNANTFLDADKIQEAIVEYRNALKEDDKFGEARLKLSQAYERAGNINQAFREAVRAADLLPANNEAQIRAANYLMAGGRFEDAKTRIQPVIERDPSNVMAQLLMGRALVGLKDIPGAIKEIEDAIQLEPNRAASYTYLASIRAQQGDREQAKIAFEKAVEVDPKSVDARVSLALFRWSIQDRVGAEDALKQAAAVDPKSSVANRALAAFYVASNRAALAEPHLKALAAGGAPAATLQLADYYLAGRRMADATAVLQPLTKDKTVAGAAETRLASIAYASNDRTKGHAMLDAVIAREPANVQALLVKSQWLLAEKKPKEALQRAQEAVKADPRSAVAHYYAGVAYDALQQRQEAITSFGEVLKINPRAVAAQVQLARLNLVTGSPESAITFAEGALASAPGNPQARVALIRGLLGRGEVDRAAQELAPLMKQYPQVSVVHSLNGAIRTRKKDPAGARVSYEKALALTPRSVEAMAGVVAVDLIQDRPQQARQRIETRLAEEPDNVDLMQIAAQVYVAQRDLAKAETTLRRAIQVGPGSSRSYAMLANVLVASNKLEAARVEFDQIVQRDSRNVAAQTMAAMIVHSQNKLADAKKRYETIINADPTAAVAANNLAWIYQQENDHLDEALRLAQGAAVRLPDSAEVQDTIGMVYLKKQLPLLAIQAFEKSLEKAPDNASYHYHLAVALKESGDAKRAREAAQQAIKLQPGHTDAQKLLAETKG